MEPEFIIRRNVLMEQVLIVNASTVKEARQLANENSELMQFCELEAIRVYCPKSIVKTGK